MTESIPLYSPSLVDRTCSTLLIIDMQEKLVPVVAGSQQISNNIRFLMDVAKIVEVPVFVSEQYPKGLGKTITELRNHASDKQFAEKLRFSAAECFADATGSDGQFSRKQQVVIAGIESHICVLQTALDLQSRGHLVFVVQDAVGSRHLSDAENALNRLRDAGVVVCVSESVAFEWCEQAGTEKFKAISTLVRNRSNVTK